MSKARPAPDDQPIGQVQIAADDELLTALGSGGPPPQPDDQVAAMLAAWRADLDTPDQAPLDLPDGDLASPTPQARTDLAVPISDRETTVLARQPSTETVPARRSIRPPTQAPTARPAPGPRRTRRQPLRRALIGAAAVAIVLIGLGVAAHQSGPGSPLWPLTRVAYPQRAEVMAAEAAIADARSAVNAGRDDDARRLLADASSHVARVDNQATAERLRSEIADIQRQLDTVAPTIPTPSRATPAAPTGVGNPASPTPTRAPAGTAPNGGQPRPGPTGGKAPATTRPPVLRTSPLPSLPVPRLPLPSLPLPPSILPSLPIHL
jgi:Anti-sigma-D factor RsdA to sigma factor binding region